MANISFNPALMTAPQNTFLLETQGYMQGLTQQDWASRAWLEAGIVGSTVTMPIWGGMGILIDTSDAAITDNRQGSVIQPASTTQLNGFTVFDQAINMIQTPGNNVAIATAGQSVAFYSFGTNARIPVPILSGGLSDFEGVSRNTPLYWDTVNFWLTTVSTANTVALPATTKLMSVNAANSKIVSYNSTTGAVNWLAGQACAVIAI
ncbi:hypothetical protein [Acidiphilium sp.]|uniref:hypothetical protein n=1 Tax=Acidiphilium sp. TaxID=527 RepID=UPI003CFC4815